MTIDTIKLKIKEQSKTTNTCKEIKEAFINSCLQLDPSIFEPYIDEDRYFQELDKYRFLQSMESTFSCLLYTSPSPRDAHESRMPSSA